MIIMQRKKESNKLAKYKLHKKMASLVTSRVKGVKMYFVRSLILLTVMKVLYTCFKYL